MPAANTDLVRLTTPRFTTTLAAPILGPTDTTITPTSITGLATGTAITLNIDETDASGNLTPTLREVITGVVNSGAGTITNCLRGRDGTTAQAHGTGAQIVQWWDATIINDFMTAFLNQHTQSGTHTGFTTDTIATSGPATIGGVLTPSGGLANNSVTFASLLSTIFSGAVQTYTPSVGGITSGASVNSANGFYINLGGIKLAWARIVYTNTSAGSTVHLSTISLPSSFFNTVSAWLPAIDSENSAAFQFASGDSIQIVSGVPASFQFYVSNTFNGAMGGVSSFFIGT